MSERMALCPRDGTPLICTFAFSKAEFYCLDCGGLFGWLDPRGGDATPELEARYAALQAEWDEHAGEKLITFRARYEGCEKCAEGENHDRHTTDAERAEHEQALAWLVARRTTTSAA